MSYIDVLNDAAQRADQASTRAEDASELLEQIVNGPLDTYVPTLSGEVPTAATAIENLRSQISAGTLAPIAERVTLAESQVNVTFNTVQTSGLALYVDEGEGAYRYFNFTVDGTSSVILGDTFTEGTELWGLSNEIGGEVGTAVQQTQANAQLAEDWAIKTDGTVDGTEFSSKYHAGEASASASAAATSEQNAAQSESNAGTSEQNAASSEQNASLSETNAAASESAAALSETNAATSASDASSSASAAATSESNAESSASAAEASAITATNMADSVAVATETYSSTDEGIASTVDGDYFRVASPGAKRVEVWKNATGVAEFIVEYYTSGGVDERDSKVVKLNRSLQRNGDNGQTYHADFAYDAYGLGTRMSGGVDKAVSFEDMSVEVGRATPKWVMQPTGPNGELMLTEVPVDTLAREFDPVTGEPKGLLIESEATNVETISRVLATNDLWTMEVVQDDKFGECFLLTSPDDNVGRRGIYSSLGSGGGEYSQLRVVYVKRINCRYIEYSASSPSAGFIYDFDTETFVFGSGVSEYLGDGWWRISRFTDWSNASVNQFRFSFGREYISGIGCARSAGDQLLIGSLEIYDTPQPVLSMLKPTDSPVTRAADNAAIDLSDVLNPVEGTYVVRAVVKDDGGVEYYAGYYHNELVSPRMSFRRLSGGNFSLTVANDSVSIPPPEHLKAGDIVTLAIAYNEGQTTAAAFGETRTRSSGYSPRSTIRLVRGAGRDFGDNNRSLESSGIIAGFEYYPVALSETRLAEITAFNSEDQS